MLCTDTQKYECFFVVVVSCKLIISPSKNWYQSEIPKESIDIDRLQERMNLCSGLRARINILQIYIYCPQWNLKKNLYYTIKYMIIKIARE